MKKKLKAEIEQTQKLIAFYVKAHQEKCLDRQSLSRSQLRLKDQISFFQHERLIHLLVTILFAVLVFASFAMFMIEPSWPAFLIVTLLTLLLVPYIFHYFFLENGVQKLYELYDEMLNISEASSE